MDLRLLPIVHLEIKTGKIDTDLGSFQGGTALFHHFLQLKEFLNFYLRGFVVFHELELQTANNRIHERIDLFLLQLVQVVDHGSQLYGRHIMTQESVAGIEDVGRVKGMIPAGLRDFPKHLEMFRRLIKMPFDAFDIR